MRVPATALVLGIVLLAGCLSPDDERATPGAPAADEVAPAAASEGAEAKALPATPEGNASTAPGAATMSTTLAWDGATASAVCVMPAHRCDVVQQPESSWNEFSTLGVPGRAVRASGTLTWDAASPATEELHVFVFSLDETGMPVDSARITGPSPLAFDVDLSEWTGVDFAYSLHGHREVGGAAIVETSQPFHMETTILSLVDASPDA